MTTRTKIASATAFVTANQQAKTTSLDGFTNGELVYIALKTVMRQPSAFSVSAVASAAAKQFVASGEWQKVISEIIAKALKASDEKGAHPYDATGNLVRKDTIVDCGAKGNKTKVYEVPSRFPRNVGWDGDKIFSDADFMELPDPKKPTEKVKVQPTVVYHNTLKCGKPSERGVRQFAGFVNNLVKPNAADEPCKVTVAAASATEKDSLHPSALVTKAALDTVQGIKDPTYLFDIITSQPAAAKMMIDKLKNVVPPSLSPVVFGKSGTKTTLRSRAYPKMKSKVFEYPLMFIADHKHHLRSSGMGNVNASMFDGLNLAKDMRSTVQKLEDIVIPPTVGLIYMVGGNEVLAKTLWRRQGFAKNLLIIYAGKRHGNDAMARYIANGKIVRGGVISGDVSIRWKVEVDTYYVDLTVSNPGSANIDKLNHTCKTSCSDDAAKLGRALSCDYYAVRTHAYSYSPQLWQADEISPKAWAQSEGFPSLVGDIKTNGTLYVSAHYGTLNMVVSNVDRTEYGIDPILLPDVMQVYANILMRYKSYVLLRATNREVAVKQAGGKMKNYRLGRRQLILPFGLATRVRGGYTEDFSLADYFENVDDEYKEGRLNEPEVPDPVAEENGPDDDDDAGFEYDDDEDDDDYEEEDNPDAGLGQFGTGFVETKN